MRQKEKIAENQKKEMTSIKSTVLGDPKAQKRHRSFQRGRFIGTYDPSQKEKKAFLLTVQANAPAAPIDEPIALTAIFFMSRPKGHFGTGRNAGQLKTSAPLWSAKRPDLDNLTKFVLDALNGIFWRDDAVVCKLSVLKMYNEQPRTEVLVETLSNLSEGETK